MCGSKWALDPGDSWERLNMDGLLNGVWNFCFRRCDNELVIIEYVLIFRRCKFAN